MYAHPKQAIGAFGAGAAFPASAAGLLGVPEGRKPKLPTAGDRAGLVLETLDQFCPHFAGYVKKELLLQGKSDLICGVVACLFLFNPNLACEEVAVAAEPASQGDARLGAGGGGAVFAGGESGSPLVLRRL